MGRNRSGIPFRRTTATSKLDRPVARTTLLWDARRSGDTYIPVVIGFTRAPRPGSPSRERRGIAISARADVLLLKLLLGASSGAARLGREDGQTLVEYALVMLVVAVALAGGVFVSPFRSGIEDALSGIADAIATAGLAGRCVSPAPCSSSSCP